MPNIPQLALSTASQILLDRIVGEERDTCQRRMVERSFLPPGSPAVEPFNGPCHLERENPGTRETHDVFHHG